jgi:hypothetical protein
MKYALLIYGDERVWSSMSKEQMEQVYAGHRKYGEEMTKAGVIKGGSELKPVTTATSIRFAKGRPTTAAAFHLLPSGAPAGGASHARASYAGRPDNP